METLFLGRYLLPITAAPIEDGALLVQDGRIAALGKRKSMTAAHSRAAVVDFGDTVLLPPLVNAHTHLELTHFPLWASELGESGEPESFVEWILKVIRVKRGIDLKRYQPSLADGIRRSLEAGTGAVGDILSCFPARKAYSRAPIAGHLYLETLGRDPLQARRVLGSIGEILDEGRAGELTLGLSPHSPYTLSAEYLEEVLEFGRRRQVPVSLHFAESPDEISFLDCSGGPLAERLYPFVGWAQMVPPPARRRPAAYLADRGGLGRQSLLVHGVQVTREEMDLLVRTGSTVVLCPRSNARLGVGLAPVENYRRAGIPLALGTDSLASCESLSVWDELAFAEGCFGHLVSPGALLRMATLQGAQALQVDQRMGALEPGRGASFQVFRPTAMPGLKDLEAALCSEGSRGEVLALYLQGREVLQIA